MENVRDMIRSLTTSLLVLSILMSGTGGMVLCVGDDGHVALEPSHQGVCNRADDPSDHRSDPTPGLKTSPSGAEAEGCLDMSLASFHTSRTAKHVRRIPGLKEGGTEASPAHDDPSALAAPLAARFRSQSQASFLSHSLLAQRTIVLRI